MDPNATSSQSQRRSITGRRSLVEEAAATANLLGPPPLSGGVAGVPTGEDSSELPAVVRSRSRVSTGVSGSAPGSAVAGHVSTSRLSAELNADRDLYHNPDAVAGFSLTVHKATFVELDPVKWGIPKFEVRASCGSTLRRSPKWSHIGHSPVLEWRTQLSYTGQESHLALEIWVDHEIVGNCFIPLRKIFEVSSFRKAMPILRSGLYREGNRSDDKRSELWISVFCIPKQESEVVENLEFMVRALRYSVAQFRVSLHKMKIFKPSQDCGLHLNKIHPFVRCVSGNQQETTMTAFANTPRDAEEFVFVDPKHKPFECGGLLKGWHDKYEAPLRQPPKGSMRIPAYRKSLEGELEVEFKDLDFTFWYYQQNTLDIDVFDDHTFTKSKWLMHASIHLEELMRDVVQREILHPNKITTGKQTVRFYGITLEVDDDSEEEQKGQVGEMVVEIEFLQAGLALPSKNEGSYKKLSENRADIARRQGEAFQLAELTLTALGVARHTVVPEDFVAAVPEDAAITTPAPATPTAATGVSATSELSGGGASAGSAAAQPRVHHSSVATQLNAAMLPEQVRVSFACFLASVWEHRRRRLVLHEKDDEDAQRRAQGVLRHLLAVFALDPEREEFLPFLTEDFDRDDVRPVATAEDLYRSVCTAAEMDVVLPIAYLIATLCDCYGLYGAMVRTTIGDAAAFLIGGRVGACFVEILERRFTLSSLDPPLEIPHPLSSCPSTSQVLHAARDLHSADVRQLSEEKVAQQKAVREEHSWNFLPNLGEPSGNGPHPSKAIEIEPSEAWKVPVGTALAGGVAGIFGGISSMWMAQLIHRVDREFICNPDYQHLMVLRTQCKILSSTHIDEFIANKIQTHYGFVAFFLMYMWANGTFAYDILTGRYAKIFELGLEPLGPPSTRHVSLCASGFLLTAADIFTPWEVNEDCPWTSGQVVAVRYSTPELHMLGDMLSSSSELEVLQRLYEGVSVLTNPLYAPQAGMTSLLDEFSDIMEVAIFRAEEAGRLLGAQLAEMWKEPSGRRPVSLLAFSVGCVVMHSCLKELRRLFDAGECPYAMDMICDVVYAGAPISVNPIEEWISLRQMVCGRFVNGWVNFDRVLLSLQTRRFTSFAGSSGLAVPGIENVLLAELISQHVDYSTQMSTILTQISME